MTQPAVVTTELAVGRATRSWCCSCGRPGSEGEAARIAGYTLCTGCAEALLSRVYFSRVRWQVLARQRAVKG